MLYKIGKSMFLHLNIHYTFINHDGFLEMDANVIVQVGMQLKCNINSFPVVIKCHKILIVLLIFSFLNHMGKRRKKKGKTTTV